MNRYAIVENGIVVNVVISSEAMSDNWILSEHANVGQLYADGVFSDPPVAD